MPESVIVTYTDGVRVREVRGDLQDNGVHLVVIINPEERNGGGWKPIPDLDRLELTRHYVVSIGHLKSGTEK